MLAPTQDTSTLKSRLREQIYRDGPITFCEWMKAALYDERDGYYRRGDRQKWGRAGDYRTSPERSELFAATFARYFAALHQQLGAPGQWTIVEAGAGDGSFAYGVLQTLQQYFPLVFAATNYVIDEINERAPALQRLESFSDRIDFRGISQARVANGIVFSNELLDAFPVHRVTLHEGVFREFYVGLDAGGEFEWQLGEPSSARLLNHFTSRGIRLREGEVAEVNLAIEDWVNLVGKCLARGYLITVDYGAEAEDLYASPERQNGTLRGFRQHQFADNLLANPGEQDLTSTVDWTFVQSVAKAAGFETLIFDRQDKFLLEAGLLTQLQLQTSLASDEAERLRLSTAAREMILPNGMAASFQVLVQRKKV